MIFFLRGMHMSFWLFVFWVALRVWEPNFEVSPLPDWTLTAFIFLVLFLLAFWFGKRLLRNHLIDTKNTIKAMAFLIVGAFVWELGLTVYLGGWRAIPAIFVWRFVVGMGVELLAILAASHYLRNKEARQLPEGMV